MAKTNFQSGGTPRFDLSKEPDRLLADVGRVILEAKKQPKRHAFDFLMREIPEPTFMRLVDSIRPTPGREEDHPGHAPFMMMVVYLRSHLLGDKRGGFSATDEELLNITNTLHPYLIIELMRRRGGFEEFHLPENPWSFDAVVRVRGPVREKLAATVAEFQAMNLPAPLLFTDEELLSRMEKDDIGAEIPMPVRGRPAASETMVNVRFQKLPALDPLKFADAMREVNETAFSSEPMPGLHLPEVDFVKKSGAVQRMGGENFDSPIVRAIKVFQTHFDNESGECQSAIARFYALTEMMRNKSLPRWITSTPAGDSIHPAVMVAAATVKLTPNGKFAPAYFADQVEKVANNSTL